MQVSSFFLLFFKTSILALDFSEPGVGGLLISSGFSPFFFSFLLVIMGHEKNPGMKVLHCALLVWQMMTCHEDKLAGGRSAP